MVEPYLISLRMPHSLVYMAFEFSILKLIGGIAHRLPSSADRRTPVHSVGGPDIVHIDGFTGNFLDGIMDVVAVPAD